MISTYIYIWYLHISTIYLRASVPKTHCNRAVSLEKAIQIAPFSTDCAVAFGHVVDGQSRNLNFALSRWFVLHAVRCWVVQIFQLQSENHGVSLVLTCITIIYYIRIKYAYPLSLKALCLPHSSLPMNWHSGTRWNYLDTISASHLCRRGRNGRIKRCLIDVSLLQLPSFWWTQVAILCNPLFPMPILPGRYSFRISISFGFDGDTSGGASSAQLVQFLASQRTGRQTMEI